MLSTRGSLVAVTAVLAVLVVVVSTNYFSPAFLEDVGLLITPSAERAYSLGTKHFDALHPDDYDITRAEELFEKAYRFDPHFPYLNHQLARVAFLKGDFATALDYINAELGQSPSPSPSSYYMRGLIEGYIGNYESSAKDYETYLASDPANWAAANDLAWVLLKAKRYEDALATVERVLPYWPDNAWLLNSKTIALYELDRLPEAEVSARKAMSAVMRVSAAEWSYAYPGNDPLIAPEGLRSFQDAVVKNMHTILLALGKRAENMR